MKTCHVVIVLLGRLADSKVMHFLLSRHRRASNTYFGNSTKSLRHLIGQMSITLEDDHFYRAVDSGYVRSYVEV